MLKRLSLLSAALALLVGNQQAFAQLTFLRSIGGPSAGSGNG
ncbi:MAG: hypothetical protein ABR915_24090 [Thermoguttaceae bacterium]